VIPGDRATSCAGPDLAAAVHEAGASGVIIAVGTLSLPDLNRAIKDLWQAGIHVQLSTGLTRVSHHRLRISPVSHQPLLYVEPLRLARWQLVAKRMVDVSLGTVLLLLSLPTIAVAALAIKLEDGGPVFYRQERVGRDGRSFELVKLRTMVPDAATRLSWLIPLNERNGPLFKLSNDPRVTRVGAWLRRISLDELPQLFNVLRGDMSLVGPRPALPREVAQFDAELLERTSVLPGLTGLWQVEARDNPSFQTYRRLDLFYVDNWSMGIDLAILFATARLLVVETIKSLATGVSATRRADIPAIDIDLLPALGEPSTTPTAS
jgi:exopolysaccharide biosynthesis polyprenyl glycosylphosphotransferase